MNELKLTQPQAIQVLVKLRKRMEHSTEAVKRKRWRPSEKAMAWAALAEDIAALSILNLMHRERLYLVLLSV